MNRPQLSDTVFQHHRERTRVDYDIRALRKYRLSMSSLQQSAICYYAVLCAFVNRAIANVHIADATAHRSREIDLPAQPRRLDQAAYSIEVVHRTKIGRALLENAEDLAAGETLVNHARRMRKETEQRFPCDRPGLDGYSESKPWEKGNVCVGSAPQDARCEYVDGTLLRLVPSQP